MHHLCRYRIIYNLCRYSIMHNLCKYRILYNLYIGNTRWTWYTNAALLLSYLKDDNCVILTLLVILELTIA